MKNLYLKLLCLFLLASSISCSTEIKKCNILVYNNELVGQTLIVDQDTIGVNHESAFTEIILDKGLHKIQSGGILPDSIFLKTSGIICSGEVDFVRFPAGFSNDANARNSDAYPSGPIVIGDSVVIYDNAQSSNQDKLVERMKSVIRLGVKEGEENEKKTAVHFASLQVLKLYNNNFVVKNWDYTFDNVPEQIEVSANSADFVVRDKYVVMEKEMFFVFATFSKRFTKEKIENDELLETYKQYKNTKYEYF